MSQKGAVTLKRWEAKETGSADWEHSGWEKQRAEAHWLLRHANQLLIFDIQPELFDRIWPDAQPNKGNTKLRSNKTTSQLRRRIEEQRAKAVKLSKHSQRGLSPADWLACDPQLFGQAAHLDDEYLPDITPSIDIKDLSSDQQHQLQAYRRIAEWKNKKVTLPEVGDINPDALAPGVKATRDRIRQSLIHGSKTIEQGYQRRSCIFYGPPGTGKVSSIKTTLLEINFLFITELAHYIFLRRPCSCVPQTQSAQWIAADLGIAFLSVSHSDLKDMWVGESEKRLRVVFELASLVAPVAIFFDEVQSFFPVESRTDSAGALTLLSGNDLPTPGLTLMAATNQPELVYDPALARFTGNIHYVNAPNQEQMCEYYFKLFQQNGVYDQVFHLTVDCKFLQALVQIKHPGNFRDMNTNAAEVLPCIEEFFDEKSMEWMGKRANRLNKSEFKDLCARLELLPTADANNESCPIWRALPIIQARSDASLQLREAIEQARSASARAAEDAAVLAQRGAATSTQSQEEKDSESDGDASQTASRSASATSALSTVKKRKESPNVAGEQPRPSLSAAASNSEASKKRRLRKIRDDDFDDEDAAIAAVSCKEELSAASEDVPQTGVDLMKESSATTAAAAASSSLLQLQSSSTVANVSLRQATHSFEIYPVTHTFPAYVLLSRPHPYPVLPSRARSMSLVLSSSHARPSPRICELRSPSCCSLADAVTQTRRPGNPASQTVRGAKHWELREWVGRPAALAAGGSYWTSS